MNKTKLIKHKMKIIKKIKQLQILKLKINKN